MKRRFSYSLAGVLVGIMMAVVLMVGLVPSSIPHRVDVAAQPSVIMEVLDPSLEQFAPLWRDEIGRRFPNAVGVLCHGGDFEQGRWIVKSDNLRHLETTDEVAERYQKLYPDRTIVMLCCNPGHLHLHVPGIYHATASVWCIPDRNVMSGSEDSIRVLGPRHRAPETQPTVPGPRQADEEDSHAKPVDRSAIEPDVVGNIFEFVTD